MPLIRYISLLLLLQLLRLVVLLLLWPVPVCVHWLPLADSLS